jgi:hypothetical protein
MNIDAAIAAKFHSFAAHVVARRSPVFSRLALAAARSAPVTQCIAGVSAEQQSVYLFFVAMQYIAGRGAGASAVGEILRDAAVDGAAPRRDLRQALADVVDVHGCEIRDLMETRSVQLNEVGRASSIWLALLASGPGPVTLVEVGASMGLNLHYDEYAFRWECAEPAGFVAGGNGNSAVDIRVDVSAPTCAELTTFVSRSQLPTIVGRAGIDKQPRSCRNEDDVRWVRSAIWPDDRKRLERFDKACEVMRAQAPVRMISGDAVERLVEAIRDVLVPGSELCLVHTATVGWMQPSRQRAFFDAVVEVSRMTPVRWVSCERYGASPVQMHAPGGDVRGHEPVLVGLSRLTSDLRHDSVIARIGMHNEWMEWNASARSDVGNECLLRG